jgi:hypothetical protein
MELDKANTPRALSNGKRITVDIITACPVLVWKPKEIAKTLLNPATVHHNGLHYGEIMSCRRRIPVAR